MFSFSKKKPKPEPVDVPVRMATSICGHRPVASGALDAEGQAILEVWDAQPGQVAMFTRADAERLQERGYGQIVSGDLHGLFTGGYVKWNQKDNRWEPTPKGVVELTSVKPSELKAKLQAAFA